MFRLNFSKLTQSKKRGNSMTLLLTSATLMSLSMAITSVAVEGGNLGNTEESQQIEMGLEAKADDCLNQIENYVRANQETFLDDKKAPFNIANTGMIANSGTQGLDSTELDPVPEPDGLVSFETMVLPGYTLQADGTRLKIENMTQGGVTRQIKTVISRDMSGWHAPPGAYPPAALSKLASYPNTFVATCKVQVGDSRPMFRQKVFSLSPNTGCQMAEGDTTSANLEFRTTGGPITTLPQPMKKPLHNTITLETQYLCSNLTRMCQYESGASKLEPVFESVVGTNHRVFYQVSVGTNDRLKVVTFSGTTVTATQASPTYSTSQNPMFIIAAAPEGTTERYLLLSKRTASSRDHIMGWLYKPTLTPAFYKLNMTSIASITSLSSPSAIAEYLPGGSSFFYNAATRSMSFTVREQVSNMPSYIVVAPAENVMFTTHNTLSKKYLRSGSGFSEPSKQILTLRSTESEKWFDDLAPYSDSIGTGTGDPSDPISGDWDSVGELFGTKDGKVMLTPLKLSAGSVAIMAYKPGAQILNTNVLNATQTYRKNVAALMKFDGTNGLPTVTEINNLMVSYLPATNKFYWMVKGDNRIFEWDPESWGRGSGATMTSAPGEGMIKIGSVANTGPHQMYTGSMNTVRMFQQHYDGVAAPPPVWSADSGVMPEFVYNPIENEHYIRNNTSSGFTIHRFNPGKSILELVTSSAIGHTHLAEGGASMTMDKSRNWLVFIEKVNAGAGGYPYYLKAWDPKKPGDIQTILNLGSTITMPTVFYDDNKQQIIATTYDSGPKLSAVIPQCAAAVATTDGNAMGGTGITLLPPMDNL